MNLRSVAEVAAVVAWYGVDQLDEFPDHQHKSLTEYWKTTRFLCQRWGRQLRTGMSASNKNVPLDELAEEIIVSEFLTRCLGANLFVLGELTGQPELTQIARRTLTEHAALREKVICKLEQSANPVSGSLRIERLFRKIERWTDLFVSRHSASDAALEAAFDCERCLDFADDWELQEASAVSLQLQMSALVLAIPNQEISDAVNAEAHEHRARVALSFLSVPHSRNQGLSIPQVQRMILSGSSFDSRPLSGFSPTNEM